MKKSTMRNVSCCLKEDKLMDWLEFLDKHNLKAQHVMEVWIDKLVEQDKKGLPLEIPELLKESENDREAKIRINGGKGTRLCKFCGQEKDVNDFGWRKIGTVLAGRCKSCRNGYEKARLNKKEN